MPLQQELPQHQVQVVLELLLVLQVHPLLEVVVVAAAHAQLEKLQLMAQVAQAAAVQGQLLPQLLHPLELVTQAVVVVEAVLVVLATAVREQSFLNTLTLLQSLSVQDLQVQPLHQVAGSKLVQLQQAQEM
jgi:hypothetical protein